MRKDTLPLANAGCADQMDQYQVFRQEVESAISDLINKNTCPESKVPHLLDGAASDALDASFTRSERVGDGIFFSGHMLSKEVAFRLKDRIGAGASVADPTCGAGDLLLGCMAFAPLEKDLATTISAWTARVIGLDIHQEFAATTRARLALLAAEMHRRKNQGTTKSAKLEGTFSNVRHADFFEEAQHVANADCVVMNPPFYNVDDDASYKCSWSSGKKQIAARFIEHVLAQGKLGQEIVAVLPDVLRSGTRYARWRSQVEQRAEVIGTHVYGRFDKKTDVDVFVLHLRKRATVANIDIHSSSDWNCEHANGLVSSAPPTLQELFTVSVGAVVPHRHQNLGQWYHYLSVATAPPNGEIVGGGKKRTTGSVHQAPFVAIRRTSSPSDSRRIVATLVRGREKVAVENHLIVIQPNDKSEASCRKLMKLFTQDYVQEWINRTIRCRHLTTKAMKFLPLAGWKK